MAGGMPALERLTSVFYERVRSRDVLGPIFVVNEWSPVSRLTPRRSPTRSADSAPAPARTRAAPRRARGP